MPRRPEVCYRVSNLVMTTLIVCLSAPLGLTQMPQVLRSHDPGNGHSASPPLRVQYFYLLHLQLHLDQEADKRQQQGLQRQADELRSHIQGQLHFNATQASILRQVAMEYDEDEQAINTEIAPIAKSDRDWVRINGKAAGPPPNRDRVHELGLRRQTALDDAINKLNSRLGPGGAVQIQTYLATIFSPHESNANGLHAVQHADSNKLHTHLDPKGLDNGTTDSHDLRMEGKQ